MFAVALCGEAALSGETEKAGLLSLGRHIFRHRFAAFFVVREPRRVAAVRSLDTFEIGLPP